MTSRVESAGVQRSHETSIKSMVKSAVRARVCSHAPPHNNHSTAVPLQNHYSGARPGLHLLHPTQQTTESPTASSRWGNSDIAVCLSTSERSRSRGICVCELKSCR